MLAGLDHTNLRQLRKPGSPPSYRATAPRQLSRPKFLGGHDYDISTAKRRPNTEKRDPPSPLGLGER